MPFFPCGETQGDDSYLIESLVSGSVETRFSSVVSYSFFEIWLILLREVSVWMNVYNHSCPHVIPFSDAFDRYNDPTFDSFTGRLLLYYPSLTAFFFSLSVF